MHSIQEDVCRLVEGVWAAVLDLEVSPQSPPGAPGDYLTGSIPITGAWRGRVVLACAPALACEAAGRMFGVPAAEVTAEQVHDALGELTNMVGGNVKALLPGASYLGLPAVAGATDGGADGPCLVRAAFECRGWPLQVAVVAAAAR